MNLSHSDRLLAAVRRRLVVTVFGRRFVLGCLVFAAAYAVLLLVSRLSGLIPDWFQWWTLAVVPGLALVSAIALRPRISLADAGRAVDVRSRTSDLFLTVSLLEDAPGEFKPLVARDAEERAQRIRPADVVPFSAAPRLGWTGLAVAALVAGVLWLPQLDPFGQVASAKEEDQKRERIKHGRDLTQKRIEQIRRDETKGEESKDLQRALDQLQLALNELKPLEQQLNVQRLDAVRRPLEDKWQTQADRIKEFLASKPSSQKFGSTNRAQLEKWQKDLQDGRTDSLQESLEEMKQELERLAKSDDPQERAEASRKLRKQLQALRELAREQLKSKALCAACDRALEQLELAQSEGLSTEALEALAQSLELSQLELEELAQSVEDLKRLEDALKTLQLAKQCNKLGQCDGSMCQGFSSLDEYQRLYEQIMAGMGGPGTGEGGKAPEDDTIESDFSPEKAQANLQAGKTLLTLKTRGVGETGDVRLEYREAVREVKQGWSEAVRQERIPPGYTEGIKKYFDSIEVPEAAP
ncbi:MAG TPA: hypothetical protein VML55_04635 [Planctomycetaceae bacterium]|nr:hypothetical protein [Planctomycetaceae bacterium]